MDKDSVLALPDFSKVMTPAFLNFTTRVQKIQAQVLSSPVLSRAQQIQESIARIQPFQSQPLINSLPLLTKQIEEYSLRYGTETGGPLKQISAVLNEIDWDTLDSLEDDEIVPKEIEVPIQMCAESISITYVQAAPHTKKDFFSILGFILAFFSAMFGNPYDWYMESQAAVQEEQDQLVEQQKLELLQQIADNTQNISSALQESPTVFSPDERSLEDSVESNCCCNHSDENTDSKE